MSWSKSSSFRESAIFEKKTYKHTFHWLLHQPEIQRQKSQLGRSKKCNESITYLSSVFTFGATFTATLIRLWRLTFLLDFGFLLNSSFRWFLFSPSIPLLVTRIASRITGRSCSGQSFYNGTTTNRLTLFYSFFARFFAPVTLIDISKLIVMHFFAYKCFSSAMSLTLPSSSAA